MDTLTDSAFQALAERTLAALEVAIEGAAAAADIDLEVTRHGNVLEIECENGSKLIVNSQAAMQEIWVAAKAGGFHFRLELTGNRCTWVDTRSGEELHAVLSRSLGEQSDARMHLLIPE